MIIVRVELHSAVTHRVIELARMHIFNVGGTVKRRHYKGCTFRGRDSEALDGMVVSRDGEVTNHDCLGVHVWNLVCKMLEDMGYVQ